MLVPRLAAVIFTCHSLGGAVALKLTSDRTTYYEQENILVHVIAEGPRSLLKLDNNFCLPLILRLRPPNGFTRSYSVTGEAGGCKVSMTRWWPLPSRVRVEMDIDTLNRMTWENRGEFEVDVAYLAEGAPLATSNTLLLNIADAAAIPRKWGPQVKGVAADVTLDRDLYALGQDIPLHIAVENFAADVPIYGTRTNRCHDIVSIEVRDSADGLLVKKSDWDATLCGSSDPIPSPTPPGVPRELVEYHQGEVFTQELTLRHEGWLPDYPGKFTVSVTAAVYTPCAVCVGDPKPYAVAHSGPREFRVIDGNHPQWNPALPVGILTGERANRFEQVDTALGEKSALKDKATGLQWLHLGMTTPLSYNEVRAEMAPGKRFEGWRYATPAELRELFSHFDGAPDGFSTDPAIAAQLRRNLVGPLANSVDSLPSVGLLDVPSGQGHGTFGYIADDAMSGAVIDPRLNGSCGDANGDYSRGSYLVQAR